MFLVFAALIQPITKYHCLHMLFLLDPFGLILKVSFLQINWQVHGRCLNLLEVFLFETDIPVRRLWTPAMLLQVQPVYFGCGRYCDSSGLGKVGGRHIRPPNPAGRPALFCAVHHNPFFSFRALDVGHQLPDLFLLGWQSMDCANKSWASRGNYGRWGQAPRRNLGEADWGRMDESLESIEHLFWCFFLLCRLCAGHPNGVGLSADSSLLVCSDAELHGLALHVGSDPKAWTLAYAQGASRFLTNEFEDWQASIAAAKWTYRRGDPFILASSLCTLLHDHRRDSVLDSRLLFAAVNM